MIQFQLFSFEKRIRKGTYFFFQINISFLMDGHTNEVWCLSMVKGGVHTLPQLKIGVKPSTISALVLAHLKFLWVIDSNGKFLFSHWTHNIATCLQDMWVAKDNETCRELGSSPFLLDLNNLSDFTMCLWTLQLWKRVERWTTTLQSRLTGKCWGGLVAIILYLTGCKLEKRY